MITFGDFPRVEFNKLMHGQIKEGGYYFGVVDDEIRFFSHIIRI